MSSSNAPLVANATRDLAQFASSLRFEDLPKHVIERIKLCVLDSIGCTLFGATLPWTRKVAEMALAEGAADLRTGLRYGQPSRTDRVLGRSGLGDPVLSGVGHSRWHR